MYSLLRPILFSLPAEKAHDLTLQALKWPFASQLAKAIYGFSHPSLHRNLFGLEFDNPVGLAAGLDKNAMVFNEMADLGFGFVEIGTLTPKAQNGNPKPRLFRLKADQAIINRMGFNNLGVEQAVHRLRDRKTKVVIGGNIGKNKDVPNSEAVNDYLTCFEVLSPYVDYFAVNVSSPNTPGLRELQDQTYLVKILSSLQDKNSFSRPILLKISPDLNDFQLDEIAWIAQKTELAGLISSNTTVSRQGLQTSAQPFGEGGLSGKPLKKQSNYILSELKKRTNIPIVAVGGIMSAQDAIEKISLGASLVQVYTGLVYRGPELIREIKKGLVDMALS
jgi:dihydroorotate dehydrogenase